MNALIFAAGLGTRLRPFTLEHPKALVPVCGEPMLARVIRRVTDAGARRVVVNVHHFADQIVDFLQSHTWPVEVVVSDESDCLLDTGGGILRAQELLIDGDEPFLVHNADILTDFDLAPMLEAHRRTGAMATLMVAQRESSRCLLFDDEMTLRGWYKKPADGTPGEIRSPFESLDPSTCVQRAFGGVHVLSPRVFPQLKRYGEEAGRVFPIVPFYLSICRQHVVKGYTPAGHYLWHDVGTTEKLAAAEKALGCR